jgi:hypothetical protein
MMFYSVAVILAVPCVWVTARHSYRHPKHWNIDVTAYSSKFACYNDGQTSTLTVKEDECLNLHPDPTFPNFTSLEYCWEYRPLASIWDTKKNKDFGNSRD